MRLLIDIGHPAHVHLFRHLADDLISRGWQVLFSVRPKSNNVELLKALNLPFSECGVLKKSISGKIASLFTRDIALYRLFKSYMPTITISHSSFYLSQVSWLCGIPNITLEDTGNLEQVLLYLPFTNVILTPESYHRNHGKKQIRYNGFHETAYIHPDFAKLSTETPHRIPNIILIRLVDWTASHDIGHKGLSVSCIQDLIRLINDKAEIKMLSEKPLPAELQRYALQIEPHELYDYLSHVKLYIGEGATLASECALMGIPAIYVNSRSAGVIQAQVEAGLLYHFTSGEGVIYKARELLLDNNSVLLHRTRAAEFLSNKINLSKLLVWFVENWPESYTEIKKNSDYQLNFK